MSFLSLGAFSRTSFGPLVVLVAATAVGCSSGGDDANRPARAPVSGVITYKGAPVAGADVTFAPEGTGNAASGKTDEQGRYELRTFKDNDGAVPGRYKVLVTKMEGGGGGGDVRDPNYRPNPKQMAKAATEAKHVLPKKYSDVKASTLSATVPEEGSKELNFELTD